MNTPTQNPSYDELLDRAVAFAKHPDMPPATPITLVSVLMDELTAHYAAIPDTTRAVMLGVASALLRETATGLLAAPVTSTKH